MRFKQLRAVIKKISDYAASRRVDLIYTIQTNASVFTDQIVEFLDEYKFKIGISLDGAKETHDILRVYANGKSTFEPFEKNYSRYREFLTERAGILTTVSSLNANKLKEILDYIKSLGFKAWTTTIFDLVGRGETLGKLSPSPQDYFESIKRICDGVKNHEYDDVYVGPVITYLENILLNTRPNMCLPGNKPCGAGTRLLNLESNGTINGCDVIHQRELDYGNLNEISLEQALASEANQKVKNRHQNLSICHSCTWLGNCGGTCLGRSTLTTLNSFDCQYSQLVFPYLMDEIANHDYLLDYFKLHFKKGENNPEPDQYVASS